MFVYDGSGTLVAEYTALVGNDPAPAPQVSHLTADHLGCPMDFGFAILDFGFLPDYREQRQSSKPEDHRRRAHDRL